MALNFRSNTNNQQPKTPLNFRKTTSAPLSQIQQPSFPSVSEIVPASQITNQVAAEPKVPLGVIGQGITKAQQFLAGTPTQQEIETFDSGMPKFTAAKPIVSVRETGEDLARASAGLTGGFLNTIRLLNRPAEIAGGKLEELVTGKQIDTTKAPINQLLRSQIGKTESQQEAFAIPQETGAFDQFRREIVSGVPQLAPTLAGLPPVQSLAFMGTSAAGSGARQAELEGASPLQQVSAGGAKGLLEVATEFLPTKKLEKFVSGTGTAKDLAIDVIAETVGEALSEALSPAIETIYNQNALNEAYVQNTGQTLSNIANAGLQGGALALLVGGAVVGSQNVNNATNDPSLKNLAQVAKDIQDATNVKLFETADYTQLISPEIVQQEKQRILNEYNQKVEDFNQWRKDNSGGAFGRSDDLTFETALYELESGIDINKELAKISETDQQILERLAENRRLGTVAGAFNLPSTEELVDAEARRIFTQESTPADDSPFIDEPFEFSEFAKKQGVTEPIRFEDKGQTPFDAISQTDRTRPTTLEQILEMPETLTDVGPSERWTTDIFRQTEKVFGDNVGIIQKQLLDPFDAAKKARVESEIELTDKLMNDIVKELGIKRRSRDSALVQEFGEKKISDMDLVDEVGVERANKIVAADKWFRDQYAQFLQRINNSRALVGKPEISFRSDYYRHFKEMGDTFQGIKNVFESNRQIDPALEGLSEFTKPKEKWASFKQQRTGDDTDLDAVGGFLDYIKAGTYAKHIDPQIAKFRDFNNKLAEGTKTSKAINNYIGFLDEYANDLAGKTNRYDRLLQGDTGRKALAIVNLLSSRMKSNAVLGNISSSLSQIANVPQGMAYVKNPQTLSEAAKGYLQSLTGEGDTDLYNQSGFLKERFTDSFSQFDDRIIDKPKKLAQWALGVLDETGTKFIWSSIYRKAVKDGESNPVKFADNETRKLVAGRGIGEVPIRQKSKLFQLIAPFTLEVNNLWKVQKDFVNKKDFGGLAILYLANMLLNDAFEEIRGSGVVFDPISALIEGFQSGDGIGDKFTGAVGQLGGEVLSNIPLGQTISQVVPEFGTTTDIPLGEGLQKTFPNLTSDEGTLKLPGRQEIFGKTDPTRFGTGLPIVKALQSPTSLISSFGPSFGGQQLRKTIQGGQALGLLPEVNISDDGIALESREPASVSKSGRLRTPIEVTPPKVAQGLTFGEFSLPEVRQFFDEERTAYGKKQTENFNTLVDQGFDSVKLNEALVSAKEFKKRDDRIRSLIEAGYTDSEVKKIANTFFGYKF